MMEPSNVPPSATVKSSEARPTLVRGLSLLDSVLLLAGGIIGSSIFLTAKDIASPLPHPLLFLLVWVLGGVISLCACLPLLNWARCFQIPADSTFTCAKLMDLAGLFLRLDAFQRG